MRPVRTASTLLVATDWERITTARKTTTQSSDARCVRINNDEFVPEVKEIGSFPLGRHLIRNPGRAGVCVKECIPDEGYSPTRIMSKNL